MSERGEMEAAIEAILFVSSEPVPRARLIELFDEDDREQAAAALDAVLARYTGAEARGVMVEDVAGGVRLVTRPEMGVWLRRFFEVASSSKLSMAALETLAIIAYRQPITGPEIQELRGVSPVGVLKTLLEKRLVRIAGRKEVVGKPFLYATTREFLVHFGLNGLRDLPPLEEFEETFGAVAGIGGAAAAGAGIAASGGAGAEAGTVGGGGVAGVAGEGDDEDGDREERILREAAEIAEREAPEIEEREAEIEAREALAVPEDDCSDHREREVGSDELGRANEEEATASEDWELAAGWREAVEEEPAGDEETAAARTEAER